MNPRIDLTLYLVTDRGLARGRSTAEVVREAVAGGATVVQLREKDVSTRAFLDEALELKRGADYLGVSPVFDTPTKTDAPRATGLDGLAAIRAATRLPLVAIGGLNAANAADAIRAGADGIAVVSAIVAAADPRAAASALREAIRRGRVAP